MAPTLPPLPEEYEDPYFPDRQAFDVAVRQQIESAIPNRYLAYIPVATGSEPRPSDVARALWVGGSTRPANMINGDLWLNTGAATPTAPSITTTSLNSMVQGATFSQTLSASGVPTAWAVTAGALPAGLTLNVGTGVISGTPTAAGSYSVTIRATNAHGNGTRVFTGTVSASGTAPTISTTSIASMTQGAAYSQALLATGSTPITWGVTSGALPTGIGINSSTGALSGTPTVAGAFSFTITATNAFGSNQRTYSGTVAGPSAVAPVITTTTLSALSQGVAFTQTLAKTGTAPITFSVISGSLPAGLSLNSSTGTLSGMPTTSGVYTFTVRATNSAGSDDQAFSGTIGASVPQNVVADSGGHTTAATALSDGGGSLYTGNSFYAVGKPIRVLGMRFWNPADATAPWLADPITAYAYGRDYTGEGSVLSPTWGTPNQSKAQAAGSRVAGTWTTIMFDTPFTIGAVSSAAGGSDCVTIAVKGASGNIYTYVTSVASFGAAAVEDPAGNDVYIAEQGFQRSHNSAVSSVPAGPWYGVDLIWENA